MTGALSLRPALALPRLSGRHGLPRQGAAPRSQDLLLHAAMATLTLVVLTGIYSGHHGTPTPKGAAYAIVGATATERQIVEEIQDRYTTEGLELPDLRVTFTDQDEPCRGYDGYYIYGQALVTFCRPADEGWGALGKLVTHEFAHALGRSQNDREVPSPLHVGNWRRPVDRLARPGPPPPPATRGEMHRHGVGTTPRAHRRGTVSRADRHLVTGRPVTPAP